MLFVFFFFFSSRRRHTRFDCDWSSDVCSSDLRARDALEHAVELSVVGREDEIDVAEVVADLEGAAAHFGRGGGAGGGGGARATPGPPPAPGRRTAAPAAGPGDGGRPAPSPPPGGRAPPPVHKGAD